MSTRAGRDRGSSAVFFVILAFPLLVLIGLAVDGGRVIVARQRASDIAVEAARKAADACDPAAFYANKGCEVSVADGDTAAQAYVTALGDPLVSIPGAGGVVADPALPDGNAGGFTVNVQIAVKTPLLDIIGKPQVTVSARQSAQSITREN